jgi:hypothetical protein
MGITKCCYTHGEGGGPLSKWELYAHSYCALLHDVHEINVPMMKEGVSTVETSVSFCQTTRQNIPEDNHSQWETEIRWSMIVFACQSVYFNSIAAGRILIKFGMNVMKIEANWNLYSDNNCKY